MTQLSPHFSLEEFTRSDKARALVPPDANQPTPAHLENLMLLAENMELVRSAVGDRVIFVSSAYRNKRVNEAAKGVSNSAHALGLACDFLVIGLSLERAAKLIVESGIKFDQLIHEKSRGVLHISFEKRARKQVLTQAGGAGTPVTKGISWNV